VLKIRKILRSREELQADTEGLSVQKEDYSVFQGQVYVNWNLCFNFPGYVAGTCTYVARSSNVTSSLFYELSFCYTDAYLHTAHAYIYMCIY
jgi:hypothetical protein